MTEVLVGAADWRADSWKDAYYPEDMPEEWQLTYYANEYFTTLIDCQEFCDPEYLDRSAELLEDCPYSFRPVLRVKADRDTPEQVGYFIRWLAQLDENIGLHRLAGVWLSFEAASVEHDSLLSWREVIAKDLPIALDVAAELPEPGWTWLSEHGFSAVWRAGRKVEIGQQYWLASLTLAANNRQVAADIRDFLGAVAKPDVACIVVEYGYEDVSRLSEISTIVNLVHGR